MDTIRVCMFVLEDDAVQVKAIQHSIKAVLPNCTLRLEENGRTFLQNLSNLPLPDILVLDLNVPIISGIEVLEKIRSRKDLDWLPVVMFSTDDSSATRLKAMSLGATAFEQKPASLLKMGTVLKEIVERYSYKGQKPDQIKPLMSSSLPPKPADGWNSVDDLLNDL